MTPIRFISRASKIVGVAVIALGFVLFIILGLKLYMGSDKVSGILVMSIPAGLSLQPLVTLVVCAIGGGCLFWFGGLLGRLDKSRVSRSELEAPDQPSLYGEGHTREYRRMEAYLRDRPERK